MTADQVFELCAIGVVAIFPLIYAMVNSFAKEEPSWGLRSIIVTYLSWAILLWNTIPNISKINDKAFFPFIIVGFVAALFMGCYATSQRQPGGWMSLVLALGSVAIFILVTGFGTHSIQF